MPLRFLMCLALAAVLVPAGMARAESVFINEFHYDNSGTDADEGVEIVGPAGTNLSGFTLLFYNGSGGTVYNTVPLGGTIPNEGGTGFGAVWFAVSGVQNDMEGLVLVQNSGPVVVQALAYEGSFTAVGGAAGGMTLGNIGVSQPGTTPVGQTLQLTGGPGTTAAGFSWTGPVAHSRGLLNAGQSFGAPAPSSVLTVSPGLMTEGTTATATLSLSPAPGVPVTVSLAAAPGGVLGVPGSVVVPAGGTATFSVTALADGVPDGFQESAVTATPGGVYPMAATAVQVVDADRPARSAPGVLRMMSLNVRLGIGAVGTAEFRAVREVIERISPDVLVMQEVSDAGDFGEARALLEQAGFPAGAGFVATRGDDFAAAAYSSGDFGTGECLVTASRFPIVGTVQIGRGVAGRKELTRFPLYTRIDLPDTAADLHVINVHLKAGTLDTDRFRKAVEAYRIREFLTGRGLNAVSDQVMVAGDFNAIDTIFLPALSYNTSSYTPPSGTSLPVSYQLGADLANSPGVTLPYSVPPYNPASSVYPHQGFNPAGLFAPAIFQADGSSTSTFNLFEARFDYFMVPQRWLTAGASRGEVYNSRLEPQADGLPKRLTLPAPELSETASDHHAIFFDVNPTTPPLPALGLTVSPDNMDESATAAPPVLTVSLTPAPSGPVTISLESWRDDRLRPAVSSVTLTPGQPTAQVPLIVPFSPGVEPQRSVSISATATGYAPAFTTLTIRSAEAAGLLVFSQYVEPATAAAPPNNNTSRALELYNASGWTLDLARLKWIVRRFTNGSTSASILGSVTAVLPENSAAVLPPGQVIVVGEAAVGDALVTAGLLPVPEVSFASAEPGTLFANASGQAVFLKGSSMDFNGDDALEIVADGVRCDVFGRIGQDPGSAWNGGAGNPSTADQNLSLRPEIFTGSTGFTLPGTRFVSAGAGSGNSLAGIGVPPVPTDRYLSWAASHGLAGIPLAPNSDPDGDGRLNLIEFVEETSPIQGGPTAAAAEAGIGVNVNVSGSFLTLTPDAWLSIAWERSDSLGATTPWTPATEVIGGNEPNNRTRWQWTTSPGAAQATKRFWRYRATRP